MSKLYPIGTRLITRRLSQAALAHELGFSVDSMCSFEPEYGFADIFLIGTNNFDMPWDTWRVIVTEDNQLWLSPVPMVGDLVNVDKRYSVHTTMYFSKLDFELSKNFSAVVKRIIERTYPNGQRAPMIEWDEVIEQTVRGQK
jgi:hypothetical protein